MQRPTSWARTRSSWTSLRAWPPLWPPSKPADLDALMALFLRQRPHRAGGAAGDGARHRREHQGPPLCPLRRWHLRALCPRWRQDRRAGKPRDWPELPNRSETVGKDVAMQIAALNPRFWDKSQVDQATLDEEKKILLAQMENDPKMASKPEKVKERHRHRQAGQVLQGELPAAAGVREG